MSMRDLSRALAEVVREVSRSVITIYTVRPSLESFFGLAPLVGAGSGFIVGELNVKLAWKAFRAPSTFKYLYFYIPVF